MVTGRLSCSVVLGTRSDWDEIRPLVADLLRQVASIGGEVVVADGLGRPAPSDVPCQGRLVWIPSTGLGAFDLRTAAIHAARGDIVVLTEDHCIPDPDWAARLVALHARHADIDIIKGSVRNGTRDRLIDRAAFTLVQWRNVPPIDLAEASRLVGIGGVAFKRRALDAVTRAFPAIAPEMLSPGEMRRMKLRVLADASLSVTHLQQETWLGHGRLHFHNARAVTGTRRRHAGARDWGRVLGAPVLLPWRVFHTIRQSAGRRDDAAVAMIPPLAWLYLCKGAGECLGMLLGPGDSGARLH